MIRVTTWNVNGLRGALKCGAAATLAQLATDVLMMQEIRVRPDQLDPAWADPAGWTAEWHPAEQPGYAGVATWARRPMERLGTGIDGAPDPEGRVLHTRLDVGVQLVNVYIPSGSRGPEAQARKDGFLAEMTPWLATLAEADEPVIVAGDLNVAHTADDLFNPTANRKHSGFLPHERAWFDDLLDAGWHDATRAYFGARKGPYSWWSNRGRARQLDRGWRLDYLLANRAARRRCGAVRVDRRVGIAVSDHAPVTLELSLTRATRVLVPASVLRTGVDGEGEQSLPGGATKRKKKKTRSKKKTTASGAR